MSKPFRVLLALLAALATVFLWGGTATADLTVPTAEECASGTPPASCPPMDEGGGDTGTPDGDTTGPEDDGDTAGTDRDDSTDPDAESTSTPDDLVTELDRVDPPGCDEIPGEVPPDCPGPSGCEDPENLPDCIPDCELLAELLGLVNCGELPECLDLSQLPQEIVDLIDQLPGEAADDLPFCPAEEPLTEELPTEEPPTQDPPTQDPPTQDPPTQDPPGGTPVAHEVGYENCDDARAQGAAPVHSTDPGYGPHLDRDGDGIGCEDDATRPVAYVDDTGRLAYTGAAFGPQLTLGAALVLLGSGFRLLSRRRARTPSEGASEPARG